MSDKIPMVVNDWTLFTHPLFAQQYQALKDKVEALKVKDLQGYAKKNDAKRLAAIYKLAFEVIPQDPTLADYRQGTTLGDHHKHWFHAKFYEQLTATSQPGRSK
ncbi:type II toxin-antitoxin system YhaV family toxin, partial [Rheinheimera soli]|uniref:type II toxin-antitoxin system YhaV family toxin n=1 Tax=Rheinheimera soli TaxID=443616 RepID=UPI001E3F8598